MLIKNIFEKDINREIEAVIQAEYIGEAVRKKELEEFVLTCEGEKQLKVFLKNFVSTKNIPTNDTSVWISGFFGSGKSHFMKIIGYLMGNEKTGDKCASEYLISKTNDHELKALIEEAVSTKNDAITFNISSQSRSTADTTADLKYGIAEMMYRQFNESLGFSKNVNIAEIEHTLTEEGKYKEFCEVYENLNGKTWQESRESHLRVAKTQRALDAIGYEDVSAKDLFKQESSKSVEDIVTIFTDYAKQQGPDFRLMFLIDEISQYIGNSSRLILELQTIVELAGSKGRGQVWIIVTSQKSLNDAVPEGQAQSDDYSKIQARFKNRISLTSSDTDEVVKKRLLKKNPQADLALKSLYQKHRELMVTTMSFISGTTRLPNGYKDEAEFVDLYPLLPYEIPLLQEVFEKIRDKGEGGASTSSGERSILAAAQIAIQQKMNERLGALVTMADFYPAIEQKLNPDIVKTIEQASDAIDRGELSDFDLPVLYTLYFLRGIETVINLIDVDNLSVMLLPTVESLRKETIDKVKNSLRQLVAKLFVSKKIDGTFEFMTSEEKKASEAIKQIQIENSVIEEDFKKNFLTEILPNTKRFVKYADRQLGVEVYWNNGRVPGPDHIMRIEVFMDDNPRISPHSGTVRIQFHNNDAREILDLIERKAKTNKYITSLRNNQTSVSSAKILLAKQHEVKEFDTKINQLIKLYSDRAVFFVADDELKKGMNFETRREEALSQILSKTFNKIDFVRSTLTNANSATEWKKIASGNHNVMQKNLNSKAIDAMLFFLEQSIKLNSHVTIEEAIDYFIKEPYGWEIRDIIAIILYLIGDAKFKLTLRGENLSANQPNFVTLLETKRNYQDIIIETIEQLGMDDLKKLSNTIKKCFPNGYRSVKLADSYDDIGPQLDQLFDEAYSIPLSTIETRMNRLTNKVGLELFEDAKDIEKSYPYTQKGKSKISWLNKYGIDSLSELEELIEDLNEFYDDGSKVNNLRELYTFYTTNKLQLDKDAIDGVKDTTTFINLVTSKKLPGRKLNEMEALQRQIQSNWKNQLEVGRQQTVDEINEIITDVQSLNTPGDNEIANIVNQSVQLIQRQLKNTNDSTNSLYFATYINEAKKIFKSTTDKLNQLNTHRVKEKAQVDKPEVTIKVFPVKSKDVMATLFPTVKTLSTEEDVKDAVRRLEEKLLNQIKEGTIVIEL